MRSITLIVTPYSALMRLCGTAHSLTRLIMRLTELIVTVSSRFLLTLRPGLPDVDASDCRAQMSLARRRLPSDQQRRAVRCCPPESPECSIQVRLAAYQVRDA